MAVQRAAQYFVGVDVGGTKILAGLFNRSLKLLGTVKLKTKANRGGDAVLDRIERAIRELLTEQSIRLTQVCAIGVGVPGIVHQGRVFGATNIGWEDVPIRALLNRRLRRPVQVENDCNLFTLGIHTLELKRKPRTMVGVFLGTGFGGGIIINNKLYTGFNRSAGEFGQMVISKGGLKTGTGIRGSLESLASRTGIVRRLRKAVLEGGETMLQEELGAQLKGVRSRHLRQAITARDPLVRRVVRSVAEDTGLGVAAIVSAFGPEYVVMGGGVIEALHGTMLPIVRKTVEAHVLPGTLDGVQIVTSALGDDGGISGAAVLARDGVAK